MRIAVSGPPGSGKTTVGMLVGERLGYDVVLVGQIFRQMAEERGVDLASFGRLAETDETIDRDLDRRTLDIANAREDVVLEGRLTGALLRRSEVRAFKVYVHASLEVRAGRIAGREGKPVREVMEEIAARERSEGTRYRSYYGVDPNDRSIYDLWVDSSEKTPGQLADEIVAGAKEWETHEAGEEQGTC
jgi:cytidylate kinase